MFTTAVGRDANHNMGLFHWSPSKVEFNDYWEHFPSAKPQALAFVTGKREARTTWTASWVGILPRNPRLYLFEELGWLDGSSGWVQATHTMKPLSSGWGSTTFLASSGPYVYQVTSSGQLWRSDSVGRSRARVASRGFAGLRSFSYAVTRGGNDTFLGVTKGGALLEYRVRRGARPVLRTSVLKAKGFAGYRYVTAGSCPSGARPIFAVPVKGGNVDVYRDLRPADGSGKDITLSSRNVADWTNRFYG